MARANRRTRRRKPLTIDATISSANPDGRPVKAASMARSAPASSPPGRTFPYARNLKAPASAVASIPRPQIHHDRGPASRPAIPAAQPSLEVHEAGVARLSPPQRRGGDFTRMPAHPAAYPHHMPGAQILKPRRIAGRHAVVHVLVLFLPFSRQDPCPARQPQDGRIARIMLKNPHISRRYEHKALAW